MTALICGSVAYDTVMVFEGHFKDHILADRIHMLNVAFLVPGLRRNFGGCAGNIGYNLKLLGGQGKVMATVGMDFGPYRAWMIDCGLSLDHIRQLDDEHTAQAYITTDADNNQITAFHPGAMNHAHINKVPKDAGIQLGIVAPESHTGMREHAAQFAAAGIPFIFDPGQAMTLLGPDDLREMIGQARWLAVNDYEASLLVERTGWSFADIAGKVEALIVTRGAQGSQIHTGGTAHEIPPAKAAHIADPTGCGDAYRGGLLYGLQRGFEWAVTGRIASLMGSIKIGHHGTQTHRLTREEFAQRYRTQFGVALEW
jgi:adenosine kinase